MAEETQGMEEEEKMGNFPEERNVHHICMQEETIDQYIQQRKMHGGWY